MRILLSQSSKEKLFTYLIDSNNCNSLKSLSNKLKISFNTIQDWKYAKNRHIPERIIPQEIKNNLEILDSQDDNWGRIKGGKETYKVILNKYGKEELDRRRQIAHKKIKEYSNKRDVPMDINLANNSFLEFYGALLGDGWLSRLIYKNKKIHIIGISGNRKLDREYLLYLKQILKKLLGRDVYIKDRPQCNSIEIYFCHKRFLNFLNEELNFPVGPKLDLEINDRIYVQGYSKVKWVIRGVFDTDGCFYFDKTPVGNPYPCINLTMKAPKLISQVYIMLIQQGFKVQHTQFSNKEQLILKGKKQLIKWMKEIGSSNKRNLDKIALVAQLDSAAAS